MSTININTLRTVDSLQINEDTGVPYIRTRSSFTTAIRFHRFTQPQNTLIKIKIKALLLKSYINSHKEKKVQIQVSVYKELKGRIWLNGSKTESLNWDKD